MTNKPWQTKISHALLNNLHRSTLNRMNKLYGFDFWLQASRVIHFSTIFYYIFWCQEKAWWFCTQSSISLMHVNQITLHFLFNQYFLTSSIPLKIMTEIIFAWEENISTKQCKNTVISPYHFLSSRPPKMPHNDCQSSKSTTKQSWPQRLVLKVNQWL